MKLILVLPFLFVLVSAQHGHHHLEEYIDYRAHPHYNYHYGVHDLKKHDIHDQWEARDGHNTKGGYSLQQPDGRKRIVEYEADKHGIHYKVKYEGHAIHEEGHHGAHGKAHSSQYYHGQTNYHGEEKGHEGGGDEGGHYGGGDEHGHAISHTHQESGHGGGGGESGGHLSHKIELVHVEGHGGHAHGKAHSSQFYHGQTNYHGEEKGHGGYGGHDDEGGDDGGHGHEVATSYKSQVDNHYGHHHHY